MAIDLNGARCDGGPGQRAERTIEVGSVVHRRVVHFPAASGACCGHVSRHQIDVTVTDEDFDIVADGYDVGVRLGGVTIKICLPLQYRATSARAPSPRPASGGQELL